MGFWIGVAFLVLCGLGVPIVRNLIHASMIRNLGWEGASPMPAFWNLQGLRIKRARWEGEVAFEPAGVGGGGRRGHLRLVASLGRKTPDLAFFEAGRSPEGEPGVPTGDPEFDGKILVKGDEAFVKKLLVPEQRTRLLRLQMAGGHLRALSGGVVELDGPLFTHGPGLREFLDQCDTILDAMVGSVTS